MKTLNIILLIVIFALALRSQNTKTIDSFDNLKINEFINFNSTLTELYGIFGIPVSKYVPDYEMCGDGFDTVFYFNDIIFYYLNWNKRNFNTENPDYIWVDRIYFNPNNEIIVKTGKIELSKKTQLDDIKNVYPNSYENRIIKNNETIIRISTCKECYEESYFNLFFRNETLVKITYYNSDC